MDALKLAPAQPQGDQQTPKLSDVVFGHSTHPLEHGQVLRSVSHHLSHLTCL